MSRRLPRPLFSGNFGDRFQFFVVPRGIGLVGPGAHGEELFMRSERVLDKATTKDTVFAKRTAAKSLMREELGFHMLALLNS